MTKRTPRYAELGSISSGTLLYADQIEAFASALGELDGDGEYAGLLDRCDGYLSECEDAGRDPDEACWLIEDLCDALQAFAPPMAYFGAHEGDGADFGFWISEDAIYLTKAEGELLQVADLAEL